MSAPLPDLLASAQTAPAARVKGRAGPLRIWLPAGFLVLLIGACFAWPTIYPVPRPVGGSILNAGLPPLSPGHIFGTDPVGNDVFSQILYGGQISFEVGFGTTAIGLVIGGLLGMAAGYRGGLADAIMMRILDVLIAFPALVLALAVAEGLGPSELHVIWALSFFSIPAFGRIARGATLALRERTLPGRTARHHHRPVANCPWPAVRLSTTLPVCCGLTRPEATRRAAALGEPGARTLGMGIIGTPPEVAARLAELRDEGADTIYLHLYDATDPDHIRLLGAEVLPQLT